MSASRASVQDASMLARGPRRSNHVPHVVLINSVGGEPLGELAPGGDPELPEHFAKVVVDGVHADEEGGADLGIGVSGCREAGDRALLRGEIVGAAWRVARHALTGRCELTSRSIG